MAFGLPLSSVSYTQVGDSSWTGGPLSIANGGTGQTSAGAVRTAFDVYSTGQTNSAILAALTPYATTIYVGANFQPLDSDLTAIAAVATTSYGRGLLALANGPAALTYIGAQAAGSYVTTSSLTSTLASYLTTSAASATYQPIGSYVTYTTQTLTTPQQTQARTNINAQVSGSYATGTGTASGTNTGDETTATIKTKLGITTLSGSNTGDQTFSFTVPSIFTSGGSSTSALSFTVASQTANLVWASPNGAPGAPTFRALVAADIPTLSYQPVGTYATGTGTASGTNTGDETATTIKSKLGITTLSGSNTGDQTFSLTVPSIFTSGGSSTSALSFTVASQVANTVWAAPNGASGAPTFRTLVVADIPSLPAYQPAGTYATGTGTASGTNTGDETITTIKSKLGITTLSGSNTGDQTLTSLGAQGVVSATVSTTDASVTTIYTATVASGTTVMIKGRVVARRTGGTAGTAEDAGGWDIGVVYKNVAGIATLVGTPVFTNLGSDQAWTITTSAGGGTNARIRVNGALNNNINWRFEGFVTSVS